MQWTWSPSRRSSSIDSSPQITAIDEELAEFQSLPIQVGEKRRARRSLGLVRWRHRHAADQTRSVDVDDDVPLVTVDALPLALATVAHVRVADADASVLGDTIGDSPPRRHLPGSGSVS